MPDPDRVGTPDPRAPWRTGFSVVFALSVYVLFAPGSQVPTSIDINDKVVHSGLFLLLGLTGVLAGLAPRGLLVALVAYAGVSEVLQAVLPIHRDGDLLDALADTVGGVVGVLAAAVVRARGRQP